MGRCTSRFRNSGSARWRKDDQADANGKAIAAAKSKDRPENSNPLSPLRVCFFCNLVLNLPFRGFDLVCLTPTGTPHQVPYGFYLRAIPRGSLWTAGRVCRA